MTYPPFTSNNRSLASPSARPGPGVRPDRRPGGAGRSLGRHEPFVDASRDGIDVQTSTGCLFVTGAKKFYESPRPTDREPLHLLAPKEGELALDKTQCTGYANPTR